MFYQANILTAVGDAIKNGFVFLWDGISGLFVSIFNELFVGIFALLTDFVLWIWNSILWPLISTIIDKMQDLPFNDLISKWEITSTVNGNLVTNFVDVNLVAASAVTALGFLLSVALIKGLLKLIPLIG